LQTLRKSLFTQIYGFDPIKEIRQSKQEQPRNPEYRRWGVAPLDDTLFVSDGTTEDGGVVGIKISTKTKKEIDKTKPIANVGNHLVYYNTNNWRYWPNHALIHKGAIKEVLGDIDKSENLYNIDKLVKARMDLPILTYNKNITIGGLTNPLDKWEDSVEFPFDGDLDGRHDKSPVLKLKEKRV
jgi:hypothetical protein